MMFTTKSNIDMIFEQNYEKTTILWIFVQTWQNSCKKIRFSEIWGKIDIFHDSWNILYDVYDQI